MTLINHHRFGLAAVFAAFAAGYFMSYALRAVNAVVGVDIATDLALGPERLGLLTSAYLVAFALLQLPLGVWLDKYGARRVETMLLLLAAAGCAVFALAQSFTWLFIGRAMIGFGVSACLMAAVTSFRLWYPPEKQSQLAAWMLVVGTTGALMATVPARGLADIWGWRGVFWLAAGMLCVAAAVLYAIVPEHCSEIQKSEDTSAKTNQAVTQWTYGMIFRRQSLVATAPIALLGQGGFIALQTLWAGPWFIKVLGATPKMASQYLLYLNAGLLVTYLVMSVVSPKISRNIPLERKLILLMFALCTALIGVIATWHHPNAWIVWPVMAAASTATMLLQARVSVSLPREIAGRGNVSLNLLIFVGAFLVQWGMGALVETMMRMGYSEAQAYSAGVYSIAIAFAFSIVWLAYFWPRGVNFDSEK